VECKNCGHTFEGKFCNECGQKSVEERFTLKEILHNFFRSFTHVDRGILYLIKELFFRPGIVAREYIEGKQKKYFNPFQYLIITVAVGTFLAVNFTLFGPKVNVDLIQDLTQQQRFFLQFNNFIYKFFNVILFISVPVASLYSWLLYKKSGFNYAENLIFNAFLAGERTLFYILLTPLFYFFKSRWYIGVGVYYISWIIYFGYAFIQFYRGRKSVTITKYILFVLLLIVSSQAISMMIFYVFFYR
jgi:hypothetical protein